MSKRYNEQWPIKHICVFKVKILICFSCPPRTFLPALCRIFLDECAPDNVLEVTARAITYYLDVSSECTRRITTVDGAIKAMCNRLVVADVSSRTSKDLAEQCIKVNNFYFLLYFIQNRIYRNNFYLWNYYQNYYLLL